MEPPLPKEVPKEIHQKISRQFNWIFVFLVAFLGLTFFRENEIIWEIGFCLTLVVLVARSFHWAFTYGKYYYAPDYLDKRYRYFQRTPARRLIIILAVSLLVFVLIMDWIGYFYCPVFTTKDFHWFQACMR